jgi:hypothetical protein
MHRAPYARRMLLVAGLITLGAMMFASRGTSTRFEEAAAQGSARSEVVEARSSAQPEDAATLDIAACWTNATPRGALPPAQPIWCAAARPQAPSTVKEGPNAWLDDFNQPFNNARLSDRYVTSTFGSILRAEHWQHNDHWMVDIQGHSPQGNPPWDFGGAAMRPDRTFRFQDGALVIEFDVAAGIQEYRDGGDTWPEVVITTAAQPDDIRPNGTYVYEAFPGHWTLGCRLAPDRVITCALLDDSAGGDATARVWELSHFQCGNDDGSTYTGGCDYSFGGHPDVADLDGAWRTCAGSDPDTNCRDRFRWVIEKNRLRWYVNDVLYMEHADFTSDRQLPDALLKSDLYVYFGEFDYKQDAAHTLRYHWDRVAVNPDLLDVPSATP